MTVEYEATIPTVQYGNVKVRGNDYNEWVNAVAQASDFGERELAGGRGRKEDPGVSYNQAVQNLQQGGLIPAPGLSSEAPAGYQAPQVQQQAQSAVPSCAHGQRKRVTGTNSRGDWVGWFCPTPKGTPDQCKAVFE